jgi:hypothetical protein
MPIDISARVQRIARATHRAGKSYFNDNLAPYLLRAIQAGGIIAQIG